MRTEFIEILKEIKSEEHLEILLPQKISNSLKGIGKSLYEICELNEDEFIKIEGLGKTKYKYLIELKDYLIANPTYIESFKEHILTPITTIPYDLKTNQSIAYNIFQTISEISTIFKTRSNLPERFFGTVEHKVYRTLSNYINHYFGLNNFQILNIKEISKKYSKSETSISTNLFDYKNRPDLVDLFLHNETGFGIKVNETFINQCKQFYDEYLYSTKFEENFVFPDENLSNIQIYRLVEVFDYTCEEISFDDSEYTFKTILKKDELLEFKAHFRILNSILRNGAKLTKEVLIETMNQAINELPNKPTNKKIKENGLNMKMFDVILKEYFKLETIEEKEIELFQFKWQYLSAQIDKTTRILHEYGSVMSKEEIFEEFQNRENDLGIELSIESLDFLHIRTTDKIHPQGGNGYWLYDENYSQEVNNLAQRVSDDITNKFNGKIYLDQFIEYTKTIDFYQIYELSSIKTNISLCSKQAVNDSNIFIHNDFKERYPEIELKGNRNKYLGNSIIKNILKIFENNEIPIEKNELINLIILKLAEDDISIKNKSNIFQYLLKFSDLGVLTKIEENNNVYFQLDKEQLDTHDIEKLGKKQEPIYKTNIRAKAITFLKENPKVKLSEVFELVKDLAPVENAKTNIYKIFNDTSLFIKETIDKEVWISLDTPNLPVPQEMHVEVSEETSEVLGNNPLPIRQLYDTIKLKRAIIDELLVEKNIYGLNKEIIYETFDSFIDITINDQRNSFWGKTLIQSIYENFCTKTDIYDRQICVMNLVGSYETFLKLISPLSETGRVSGIVEIINSMPEIQDLYNYKNQAKYLRDNKQKDNFSYILNKVKYYADLYRHNRSHDDLVMGNSKMMKLIVDFSALYLYTLYEVNKY